MVILILILLFFGPDAFPEIARLLARAYKMVMRAGQEVSELIREAGGEELMELTSVGRRELLNLGLEEKEAESKGGGSSLTDGSSERRLDDYLGGKLELGKTKPPALSRELPEHLRFDDYLGEWVKDGR